MKYKLSVLLEEKGTPTNKDFINHRVKAYAEIEIEEENELAVVNSIDTVLSRPIKNKKTGEEFKDFLEYLSFDYGDFDILDGYYSKEIAYKNEDFFSSFFDFDDIMNSSKISKVGNMMAKLAEYVSTKLTLAGIASKYDKKVFLEVGGK